MNQALRWLIGVQSVALVGHFYGWLPFLAGVGLLVLVGLLKVQPPATVIGIGAIVAAILAPALTSSSLPVPPAPSAPAPPALPSGPGVVYSQAQMEQALVVVGIPEPAAHTGGAIGMSESHGRSDAVRICPPTCIPGQAPERSYGPWQINVLAHPSVSAACAMALACVAPVVRAISSGGRNWRGQLHERHLEAVRMTEPMQIEATAASAPDLITRIADRARYWAQAGREDWCNRGGPLRARIDASMDEFEIELRELARRP